MSDNRQDTLRAGCAQPETMSIHTRKITDSCRDKDCIEDLRVYLTRNSQSILDTAAGAKVRCADLLYCYIDVEPVAFDRSHYCIDVTFYYRILADAIIGNCKPAVLSGLAVFSKRALLFGGEGNAKVFTSKSCSCKRQNCSMPHAVVEVVDPMILASNVAETCNCCCVCPDLPDLPECVSCWFDDELVLSGEIKDSKTIAAVLKYQVLNGK